MIDHAGKVALVTGAASGIGRALAAALTARGATVVAADVQGGDGVTPCDLAEPGAAESLVAQVFAAHGRLDLVCSNAGVGRNKRLLKETPGDGAVERLFAVNTFAAIRLAQAYVPRLRDAGLAGRIMITGSENSLSVPAAVKGAGLGLYAASKHAVLIAAEWLRDELAGMGAPVAVHVLLPGAVYTPLIAAQLPDPANAPPELGLIMPERCAALALDGMDRGLFYIPTHGHIVDDMRARSEGVAAAARALGLRD